MLYPSDFSLHVSRWGNHLGLPAPPRYSQIPPSEPGDAFSGRGRSEGCEAILQSGTRQSG